MKFKKLNKIVSYSEKPILGNYSKKNPVMALAVDKESKPLKGIIRKITKRKGNVDIIGFVDKSQLFLVESKNGINWKETKQLKIEKIEKIIKKLTKRDRHFIGLEDPDIITDEKGIKHVYFSIAFKLKNRVGFKVYLGHAKGKSLESLKATKPVLYPNNKELNGSKECCFVPNSKFVLNETMIYRNPPGKGFSLVSLSKIKKFGKKFKPIKFLIDPIEMKSNWIREHASPCCFLPIKHNGLLVGIVNGRELSTKKDKKTLFNKFRPGLFLFNPKTLEIPWISKEPLLEDPKATTITFASDFIQINKKMGYLYAHVNDSFIRVYKINLKELKKLLPKKL